MKRRPVVAAIICCLVLTGFTCARAGSLQLEQIKLPPGFSITVYANDVPNARGMVLGSGGTLFVRPTVTFDYIRLKEDGYTDSGGGAGLDLTVNDRTSDELGLNAGVALGIDFIGNRRYDRNWFRIETEGGWRQIVGGALGATTAHFAGGSDFTLTPDQTANGWYAKLRVMGGTEGFSMGGEVSAEDRTDHTAFGVRGTLRMGF